MLDDLREQRFAAHALGAHHQAPVPLTVAPVTCADRFLFDRDRFAGDHGFVDRAAAVENHAVDGNFFTGADAQTVPGFDVFERHIFLGPSGSIRRAVFGLRSSRARMALQVLAAGTKFQHLAEQNESCDRRRGFEIDVGIPPMPAQRRGKNLRRKRRDDAEHVGDAGTQADQSEHVQAAIDERAQPALEKWPAAPQHNRRGEQEVRSTED